MLESQRNLGINNSSKCWKQEYIAQTSSVPPSLKFPIFWFPLFHSIKIIPHSVLRQSFTTFVIFIIYTHKKRVGVSEKTERGHIINIFNATFSHFYLLSLRCCWYVQLCWNKLNTFLLPFSLSHRCRALLATRYGAVECTEELTRCTRCWGSCANSDHQFWLNSVFYSVAFKFQQAVDWYIFIMMWCANK